MPPYHFQLDNGVGFPPHGIVLDTNGRLSGTPTVAGTSVFSVCVVDTSGANKCGKVTMVISDVVDQQQQQQPPDEPSAVAITSVSCVLTNQSQNEYTVSVAGTASGPVGANANLPGLGGYTSEDYTNTSWGDHASKTPTRGAGDPASTNWTATLVVGSGLKVINAYVFAEETQQAADTRNVTC